MKLVDKRGRRFVRPWPWWAVCLVYVLGGLLIGGSVPWLQDFAGAHLGRRGFAVAFVINVAMPLLVVALSAVYPVLLVALTGTFLASLTFVFLTGQPLPWPEQGWLIHFIRAMHPILFVACVAYHVLSAATVLFVRRWRVVGRPADPTVCAGCGYRLTGLTADRCPECGVAV